MAPTSPADTSAPTLRALQALADENRLRILDALRDGERCVCELQSDLGLGQSLLSHHLRILREGGLVTDRRAGRWVHYSLAPDGVGDLEGFLRDLRQRASSAAPHTTRYPTG